MESSKLVIVFHTNSNSPSHIRGVTFDFIPTELDLRSVVEGHLEYDLKTLDATI